MKIIISASNFPCETTLGKKILGTTFVEAEKARTIVLQRQSTVYLVRL